jgi:ankyrin repeat protein
MAASPTVPWVSLVILSVTITASLSCPILPSIPGYKFQDLSVLQVAAIVNATADIEGLVEGGCDPNYADTYVIYTSTTCSSPILERLGINCTREVRKTGYTPLILAVNLGNTDVVKKLVTIPGIDLDSKHEGVGPAIWDAVSNGNLEMVKALKEAGADMDNVGGPNAASPLTVAIVKNHNSVARYLISRGVDVNLAGTDGGTPAFIAAALGNLEILKLLEKAGAVLDTVAGANKVSAVALAAQDGFLKVVDFLISKGVDLDRQGLDGDSPVYLAAVNGHLDIVKALREAGADPNIPSGPIQLPPLTAAILTGNSATALYLVSSGADTQQVAALGYTPALAAAQEGDLAVMEALAEAGADLEAAGGPKADTPVAVAAARGHAAVVRFLVEQGVDLNFSNEDGDTALDLAEAGGYEDIARILRTADL